VCERERDGEGERMKRSARALVAVGGVGGEAPTRRRRRGGYHD
jgi:hypothetical protein